MIQDISSRDEVREVIRRALDEDVGPGDATCLAVVPHDAQIQVRMVARTACIPAGLGVARRVFQMLDASLEVAARTADGARVQPGDALLELSGSARSILTAERTALNFAQRLSGIATLTRRYVDAVAGTGAVILDTRKTTPGLRQLEKYAVRCGGGANHRMGLYDRIMVKDNHLALRGRGVDFAELVRMAHRAYPDLEVEVEVDTVDQFRAVAGAGAEWILLDNMPLDDLRLCVALRRPGVRLEASGGITLDTVRAVADTGVDAISIGALTHSAPAADIALDFVA